jgi:predicted transposase YdaD
MEIVTSWMERGLEKGRQEGWQEGRQEGERIVILRQLRKRLGGLDPQAEQAIAALSPSRLEELEDAVFDLRSREDLDHWLQLHE